MSADRRRNRALALVGEQGVARWNRQRVKQRREGGAAQRKVSGEGGPERLAEQRGKRALGAKDTCVLVHDGLILPLLLMDAFLAITDGSRDFKAVGPGVGAGSVLGLLVCGRYRSIVR